MNFSSPSPGNYESTRRTRSTLHQITPHKVLRDISWRRVRQVRLVDLGFSLSEMVPAFGGKAGKWIARGIFGDFQKRLRITPLYFEKRSYRGAGWQHAK